jgi:hypothetical protein
MSPTRAWKVFGRLTSIGGRRAWTIATAIVGAGKRVGELVSGARVNVC